MANRTTARTCDEAVKQLAAARGLPLGEQESARLRAIGVERLFAVIEDFWADFDAGSDRAAEIMAEVRGVYLEPAWTQG